MAKKNRIWKLATVLCVAVCLCLSLAACGGSSGGETTTETTTVGNSAYSIRISTVTGAELGKISVYIYDGSPSGEMIHADLDCTGTVSFEKPTSSAYVAVLVGVPAGYDVQEYYALVPGENEIVLTPSVITDQEKPADLVYGLGDVMYDFSITDCNGQSYTLSQLLEEKDAVVLNFWYLNCTPCKVEFPYLELAYQRYSDSVEVLAINCEDGNDAELQAFAAEYGLSFPLAIGDRSYWCPTAYSACPTTIVIDRYGTIVYMHTGYFDNAAPFVALMRTVTGENYTQTLVENVDDILTEDDRIPDGTEASPFELGGITELDVSVPGNSKIYYRLYRLMDVTMRIENPQAYVVVDGQRYDPVNGVIEIPVSCEDTMTPLEVTIGNTSGNRNNIHVDIVFAPGNINNPINLEMGDNEIVITDVNGLGSYYTYTAAASGTLTITVQDCTAQAYAVLQLYNENTAEAVYEGSVGSDGLTSYSIYVNEGDRVQIIIGAATEDPELILDSVTIHALASLVEDGGNGVHDGRAAYSVSVVDISGNPVPGVQITLSAAGQTTVLTTDELGQAATRLVQGAYFLQLTPPTGYVADTNSYLWSPAVDHIEICLYPATVYTVRVLSAQGLPQANVQVRIYGDAALGNLQYTLTTDAAGMVNFIGKQNGTYYMELAGVSEDLALQQSYTTSGVDTMITLEQASSTHGYALGDYVDDFTVTDIHGTPVSLQSLLQENDLVILTFWRSGSTDSINQLVALQQMLDTYGDRVAVLALNPAESATSEMLNFETLYGLTFPLAGCDRSLAEAMGMTSFPTTVVIDREGRIVLQEDALIQSEAANSLAAFYTREDYVHTAFISLDALLDYLSSIQMPQAALPPKDGTQSA